MLACCNSYLILSLYVKTGMDNSRISKHCFEPLEKWMFEVTFSISVPVAQVDFVVANMQLYPNTLSETQGLGV